MPRGRAGDRTSPRGVERCRVVVKMECCVDVGDGAVRMLKLVLMVKMECCVDEGDGAVIVVKLVLMVKVECWVDVDNSAGKMVKLLLMVKMKCCVEGGDSVNGDDGCEYCDIEQPIPHKLVVGPYRPLLSKGEASVPGILYR